MAEGAAAHGPRAFRGPALYSVLFFWHVAGRKSASKAPRLVGHKSKITLTLLQEAKPQK